MSKADRGIAGRPEYEYRCPQLQHAEPAGINAGAAICRYCAWGHPSQAYPCLPARSCWPPRTPTAGASTSGPTSSSLAPARMKFCRPMCLCLRTYLSWLQVCFGLVASLASICTEVTWLTGRGRTCRQNDTVLNHLRMASCGHALLPRGAPQQGH